MRVTVSGREVRLPALRLRLLAELMRRTGWIRLLDTVQGTVSDRGDTVGMVAMSRPRTDLEESGRLIERVRGLGHRLSTG